MVIDTLVEGSRLHKFDRHVRDLLYVTHTQAPSK